MNDKPGKIRKKSKRGVYLYGLLTGLALLGLILLLKFLNPGFLQNIELKFIDLFFQVRGVRPVSDKIVIVAIDEKTIRSIGRWPWQREKTADLVKKLTGYGCDTVGFDIVFSEPETNAAIMAFGFLFDLLKDLPQQQNENIKKAIEIISAFTQNLDSDSLLAQAIRENGRAILGTFFFMSESEIFDKEKNRRYVLSMRSLNDDRIIQVFEGEQEPPPNVIMKPVWVNLNIPQIADCAAGFGYFNVVPDADGAIRRIPLICNYNGDYYQSLALRIASRFLNEPVKLYLDNFGVEKIKIGNIDIPTDISGKMMVNYAGPSHTFEYISACDIINGTADTAKLKGKIAIIGITATGLYDIRITPYSNVYPGVEIQANAAENIIQGTFLRNPWWAGMVQAGFIVLAGILISIFLPVMGALASGLFCIASIIFVISVSYTLFSFFNISFSPFYTLTLIVADYLFITSTKFFIEEKERRFIKSAFGQYLSPQLVAELVNDPDLLKLGGEEKVLTVLFSDIAGFTSISEKLSPAKLVEMLNNYTTEMSNIIMDNRGTIDKYNGDAIMAFFGAPVFFADHAACACRAVLQMQKKLDSISARISDSASRTQGFYTRIGVNTGKMVVGNMGSKNKFNYTVLGDSVNLASRLEGANKFYDTRILIGEDTVSGLDGEFVVRLIDVVKVKGKELPEKIYDLIDLRENASEKLMEFLSFYNDGIKFIDGRNWENAVAKFKKALSVIPSDKPSQIHLARCEQYIKTPPPETWDGSYSLESK